MLAHKTVKVFAAMTDARASRKFYEDLLGFELLSEDGFGLEFRMKNTSLRLTYVPPEQSEPKNYTILGWTVADIQETLLELKSRGVIFEKYDFAEQDENGIWTAPGGTRVAWFKDPHGNVLSIDQPAQ